MTKETSSETTIDIKLPAYEEAKALLKGSSGTSIHVIRGWADSLSIDHSAMGKSKKKILKALMDKLAEMPDEPETTKGDDEAEDELDEEEYDIKGTEDRTFISKRDFSEKAMKRRRKLSRDPAFLAPYKIGQHILYKYPFENSTRTGEILSAIVNDDYERSGFNVWRTEDGIATVPHDCILGMGTAPKKRTRKPRATKGKAKK